MRFYFITKKLDLSCAAFGSYTTLQDNYIVFPPLSFVLFSLATPPALLQFCFIPTKNTELLLGQLPSAFFKVHLADLE